jgi:hypothetical protein
MTVLDAADDAVSRSLVDHLEGRAGPPLILEREDGSMREADLPPADFFLPFERWSPWEQHLVERPSGIVFDLGARAGRHSLFLQERGS